MALGHLPLERIEQIHLQALIDAGAAETRNIDYKRDTYGGNDAARTEFLADVSSFANAVGGDLVVGMDAAAGVPTAFTPFGGDADAERLRLEQMARAGLEPRIANLATKAVPIAGGGSVIIVRVPQSYGLPHRVIFQGKNRFWARSSAGKYEPNVEELRAMFTQAPALAERMRNFRSSRIALIRSDNAPVLLQDPSRLVLHVVPFSHFDFGSVLSVKDLEAHPDYFPPLRGHSRHWRVNFDGFLSLSSGTEDAERQRAYVQVFRSGAVEAVDSSILRGDGGVLIQSIDATIVRHARIYATALHQLGVDPPLAVMASVVGVQGHDLVAIESGWQTQSQMADRDELHMVPVVLEELPPSDPQCAKVLRPIVDQLWNAAGRSSPLSFNSAGDYILRYS